MQGRKGMLAQLKSWIGADTASFVLAVPTCAMQVAVAALMCCGRPRGAPEPAECRIVYMPQGTREELFALGGVLCICGVEDLRVVRVHQGPAGCAGRSRVADLRVAL
eukprot:scaffold291247_cov19-Tisochrysis_lutea.AAC.2